MKKKIKKMKKKEYEKENKDEKEIWREKRIEIEQENKKEKLNLIALKKKKLFFPSLK